MEYTKNQTYNKNGDLMCGAIGCRKHKRLHFAYRGAFCDKHLLELSKIRKLIKSAETIEDEIKYRNQEMLFRKTFDEGHVMYIRKMERSSERNSTNPSTGPNPQR
jgi:hypothetical protein